MPALNIIATHETVRNSGLLVVAAERDVAEPADGQPQHEDDERARR